jgi:hypothetical protein
LDEKKEKSIKDSSSISCASYHQKKLINIVLMPIQKAGQQHKKRSQAPQEQLLKK